MKVYYNQPVIQKDGSILVEQVSESHEMQLPHGIVKREILIAQERYPSMEILNKALERAKVSYSDPSLQGRKSVLHLELEKKALKELIVMISELEK